MKRSANALLIASFVLLALVLANVAHGKELPKAPVNVNTATLAQLETLHRVGPKLAAKIIAARPIKDLAELDQIKGIGPKLLEALRPLVVFQ